MKFEINKNLSTEEKQDLADMLCDIIENLKDNEDIVEETQQLFGDVYKSKKDFYSKSHSVEEASKIAEECAIDKVISKLKSSISESDLYDYVVGTTLFDNFVKYHPGSENYILKIEDKKEPEYDCCDKYDFGPWTR